MDNMTAPTPNAPAGEVKCPDCGNVLRHVADEDWACSRCKDPQTQSGERYWRVVTSPAEPKGELMLRVWHDRWKARATELESQLLAARTTAECQNVVIEGALAILGASTVDLESEAQRVVDELAAARREVEAAQRQLSEPIGADVLLANFVEEWGETQVPKERFDIAQSLFWKAKKYFAPDERDAAAPEEK